MALISPTQSTFLGLTGISFLDVDPRMRFKEAV
jgi:hypothetical protein